MRAIWKYELEATTEKIQKLSIPHLGRVVSVGLDHRGSISLWVEVDTDARKVERRFCLVWTGREFPLTPLEHVGTVLTPNGLVWHVMEQVEKG